MNLPLRRRRTQFQRASDGSMSLMEHLQELRSRLFKASLAIVAGFGVGMWLAPKVLKLLEAPYCSLTGRGKNCTLVALQVTTPITIYMKIALGVGLIIAAPVWLYQLWAFIAPGLHKRERRWAYAFVTVATPLFVAGAVVAYLVVNRGLRFLLQFAGTSVVPMLEVSAYISFISNLMLLFGAAFEFPLIVVLFNLAGLASAKRLLGWWRIAVFLFFVFAAVATPTADPFGMSFLGLSLSALYFGAVGFAFINDKRRARNQPDFTKVADDEASSLEYDLQPVDAGGPVSGLAPVSVTDPVAPPQPVPAPLPLDRRYDEST